MRTLPDRSRRSGKLRALVACGVLAATVGAVRLVDLNAVAGDLTADGAIGQAVAQPVATTLALPTPETQPAAAAAVVADAPEFPRAPVPEPKDATPAATNEDVAAMVQLANVATPSLLGDGAADTAAEALPTTVIGEPATPEAETGPVLEWVEHRVAKGESLSRIFDLQGLDAGLLHKIVTSSNEAGSLAQIRPGQRLRFQFDENHELTRLELHRNRIESIRIAISDDGITTEEVSKAVDKRVAATAGLIESSLFVDGQKAGLSDGQIMELANIFGWDIDFALEIRAGDQFRALYEEHYLDGEKLRNGPILAAEFTNRGTTYRAVRYEDATGEIGYYDADGQSKRRAFIRTPIKFARVSSRFNPKRWHPILKKWRSHKGVDYAAPSGTPVKATGDGRVVFRGTKNGYGKTVILEHAGKYTTLYAHLSGYSKRAQTGKRVKQGQVIGYVGKTGLASGPHLHYEFRVQGQHRDPLRVKLPKSLALPKAEIAQFRRATAPLLAKLESIPAETMVASAGTSPTNP